MNCPDCGTQNRETSHFCSKCGTTLPQQVQTPPSPTPPSEASYPSVYQQPGMATPSPDFSLQPVNSNLPLYTPQPSPTIGFERSIATSLILTFVTCGVYLIIWIYSIGKDIRDYLGRDDPNPGMDIILMIVTCGIWGIYLMYKYPTLINEMLHRRGLPVNENLPLTSLLLGVFGLSFVSVLMMQTELNKLWQADQANNRI